MSNRRLAELAGLIHRSTVEQPKALNESTRETNMYARRHMRYGQDSFELSQLRQRFSKQEVIDQWDLFWNEETGTWFHSYYDRNGKRDAYDTRVADKSDPHRAALAADGVSDEADFLRASGQMGAMMESKLLLEEEEEGGDDGGVDLFGDDAGGDDAGDDAADDAGGDDTGDDAGGDEDEDKEEEAAKEKKSEPVETLKAKDIAKYGPGEIDKEIDSVITNIFTDSSMRAKVKSKTSLGYPGATDLEESFNNSMKKRSMQFLMEENEPAYEEFDIAHFTSEVARYINNYQSLLDIEGMLFNKARQFLLNQVGSDAETQFVELLATKFGLDFKEDYTSVSPALNPTAVGATGGSGA